MAFILSPRTLILSFLALAMATLIITASHASELDAGMSQALDIVVQILSTILDVIVEFIGNVLDELVRALHELF